MRTIKLDVIPVDGEEPDFSFRDNLLRLLAAPLPDGVDIAYLRGLDRVYHALEKAKDGSTVKLEDADYNALMAHIGKVRFVAYSPYLVPLMDALENAPADK